jgi:hypothetical protein
MTLVPPAGCWQSATWQQVRQIGSRCAKLCGCAAPSSSEFSSQRSRSRGALPWMGRPPSDQPRAASSLSSVVSDTSRGIFLKPVTGAPFAIERYAVFAIRHICVGSSTDLSERPPRGGVDSAGAFWHHRRDRALRIHRSPTGTAADSPITTIGIGQPTNR